MNNDLTQGEPGRVLRRFALPLFASVIFQQLYNLADSLVAGKWIGESALAAVGDSYEITLIFLAFAVGCNVGGSVVVSQLFGGKRYKELKTAVGTIFIGCTVLCLVLMAAGFAFCRPLLSLINTPKSIMADAVLYLDIYVGGLLFLFLYNIATGIFTALGDSQTPFLFLAISSVLNILMDIFFVTKLQMEVAGVAWATFICQGGSCILAVLFLLKRLRKLPESEKAPLFSLIMLKRVASVAVPSILQQSFISVGNIIIQGRINTYDVGVIAGYSAAIKFNNFSVSALTTIGNAMSNFAAQNYGAGEQERIKKGFGSGARLAAVMAVPFAAIYVVFGGTLVTWFIDNPSTLAVKTGQLFLWIVPPFYIPMAVKLVADGLLRGTGSMGYFMVSTFTDLFLRVALAYLFSGFWGSAGIWMAWPVGWLISTALSLFFYKTGVWQHKGL